MKPPSSFDVLAGKLEELTPFNRLEARGTLRIALKESGLDAKSVQPSQFAVVIERVLPQHLRDRGVEEPESVCRVLRSSVPRESANSAVNSPEEIFERLGSL